MRPNREDGDQDRRSEEAIPLHQQASAGQRLQLSTQQWDGEHILPAKAPEADQRGIFSLRRRNPGG